MARRTARRSNTEAHARYALPVAAVSASGSRSVGGDVAASVSAGLHRRRPTRLDRIVTKLGALEVFVTAESSVGKPREFVRPNELAAICGVHKSTITRWTREGILVAVRVPGSRLVLYHCEQSVARIRAYAQAGTFPA